MKTTPAVRLLMHCLVLVPGLAGAPPAGADTPSVQVRTATVVSQDVDRDPDGIRRTGSGPRSGIESVAAACRTDQPCRVRLGQRVKSGDRLLEVITAPDARMQYLQAQSAVDYARRELERQQRMLGEQLATRSQVDAAKKNLNDAIATFKALEQRGQGVEQETLRAPMDGIITRLDVSQGQRVQADVTAMLIAAEQRLIARLGVEPEDLAYVEAGTPVTIVSVFGPTIKIETIVREVHAMINPDTHLVEVLAVIPESQINHLVLGSRILGRIQLATRVRWSYLAVLCWARLTTLTCLP